MSVRMSARTFVTALGVFSAASLAALSAPNSALADKIHTGGPSGVYHSVLCPLLKTQLDKAQLPYVCTPSSGSGETLARITAEPRHIGYTQLDVLALETEKGGAKDRFAIARSDDTRECLFLATRNKQFSSYGDIQAYAHTLRFILPPKTSGAAATFDFLQKIDADGLGKAKSVTYAELGRRCRPSGAQRRGYAGSVRAGARSGDGDLQGCQRGRRPDDPRHRPHHPAPADRRTESLFRRGDRSGPSRLGAQRQEGRHGLHARRRRHRRSRPHRGRQGAPGTQGRHRHHPEAQGRGSSPQAEPARPRAETDEGTLRAQRREVDGRVGEGARRQQAGSGKSQGSDRKGLREGQGSHQGRHGQGARSDGQGWRQGWPQGRNAGRPRTGHPPKG